MDDRDGYNDEDIIDDDDEREFNSEPTVYTVEPDENGDLWSVENGPRGTWVKRIENA